MTRVDELRDQHHAVTRRTFDALKATGSVGRDLQEENVASFQAYIDQAKASEPDFPAQPIAPMPTFATPDAAVIVLAHREDVEGLAFMLEAIASACRQIPTTVQVDLQFSKEWWPDKINDAVNRTRGDRFALLCYDDRLRQDFMAITSAVMDDAQADIVFTDRLAFGLTPEPKIVKSSRIIRREMFEHGCPIPFSTLIHREWWNAMGGFDGKLGLCNNDFYFRSVCAGAKIAHCPLPLVEYREHEKQGHRSMDLPSHYAELHAKWRGLGLMAA